MIRRTIKSLILSILAISILFVAIADTNKSYPIQKKQFFVFSPDGKYLAKVFFTDNKTWVRIYETGEMKVLTQWQIPDFEAHTVRFSTQDPGKLLLADKKRLFVYRLVDDKQTLVFFQPKIKGQEIVQAYFDSQNDEVVWATKSILYKTDPAKKQQKEILKIPWEKGSINSIAGLDSGEYAVNLQNSNKILLLTPENRYQPVELGDHKAPIVGLQSTEEKKIISLDSSYELIVWNKAKKAPETKIRLERPSEDSKLLGFTLDDKKKNILVLSKTKNEFLGQKYAIDDLKRGVVKSEVLPVSMTSAGNVYSSINSFLKSPGDTGVDQGPGEVIPETNNQIDPKWLVPIPKKKRNTLYDLAKIEAENRNYEAALDLIKKVALDDPEYGKSRRLRRQILDRIRIKNSLDAAREQYRHGNYKSAKIILEDILVKHPKEADANRLMGTIDQKLSKGSWLKVLLILILILLVALLGFLLWWYQTKYGQRKQGIKGAVGKKPGFVNGKQKKVRSENGLRREFVYKLDETRKKLNHAAASDADRRFKNTWMEMTARLNTIEKRARLNDSFLVDFIEELDKVQASISKLKSQTEKKSGFESNDNAEKKKEDKEKEKRTKSEQTKSESSGPNRKQKKPDYHEILGVPKNAPLEEIKRAYRNKMKEYHPDRHNSSDFKWVKEEADRRTKIVQEAYVKLTAAFKQG